MPFASQKSEFIDNRNKIKIAEIIDITCRLDNQESVYYMYVHVLLKEQIYTAKYRFVFYMYLRE